MKKFNFLLSRAHQRIQKLKNSNQTLVKKESQNNTIHKQPKVQESSLQKQQLQTNQTHKQLNQNHQQLNQSRQQFNQSRLQLNQNHRQSKLTNQNVRQLKQNRIKTQDSQRVNNKSISGEIVQKLQQKLNLKRENSLKHFEQKLQNDKQQQSKQIQYKKTKNRQPASITPIKKPQKNTRTQSFAQYTFSQNELKCLKQIQSKQQLLSKSIDYQDSSRIKKVQSSPIIVRQKYKCKFFHSGSNINENTSQLAFIKKWVYGMGRTPDKFLISSWNLNGLKKSVQKRFMFGYLKLANPDIFCIQQLKMDYDTYKQNPINIEGYNSYWNFCKCSKGYSGVAVFSKFAPIRVIQDFPSSPQFSQQGRILTLQFQNFFLVNTYFPASGQHMQRLNYKVLQYQPVFRKFVTELSSIKQVIIAGDMNVARSELDAYIYSGVEERQAYHPMERNRFQQFLKQGWIDTFRHFHPKERKFTWWNIQLTGRKKNMGKRIDYYLVKNTFLQYLQDSDVMNHIWGSDHCPIELKVNFKLHQNSKDAYLKGQNNGI